MKTKHVIWIACALLLIGGAVWFGCAMWRAHRRLVTLDVYRMPLSEVLRKIEAQTWVKIRADQSLNSRITLHVTNQPLEKVLERIAEQAGARFTTVFAAYVSKNSLTKLESALRQNAKLEFAGWTKVAPKIPAMGEGPDEDVSVNFKGSPNPRKGEPQGAEPGTIVRGPGPGPERGGGMPPGAGMRMMVRQGPNGVTVIEDDSGTVEEWSPTELVVETSAKGRMGDDEIQSAGDEQADEAAKRINGDWTKYYVLRKTKFAGFPRPRLNAPGPRGGPRESNGPMRPDFELARREPLERFAKLTPEERVQRARQRRGPIRVEVEANN